MELPQRAVIIGVNTRDLENNSSSQHIFADVILIDKSHNSLLPQLYQVKGKPVEEHEQGYTPIERDGFLMIGEVIKIDKVKKQIHLNPNKTVSYNYLILASGMSQSSLGSLHDHECAAGVHTLLDALKIRKNLPLHLLSPETQKFTKMFTLPENFTLKPLGNIPTLENIVKLTLKPVKAPSFKLSNHSQRVYEVQL